MPSFTRHGHLLGDMLLQAFGPLLHIKACGNHREAGSTSSHSCGAALWNQCSDGKNFPSAPDGEKEGQIIFPSTFFLVSSGCKDNTSMVRWGWWGCSFWLNISSKYYHGRSEGSDWQTSFGNQEVEQSSLHPALSHDSMLGACLGNPKYLRLGLLGRNGALGFHRCCNIEGL